MPLALLRFPFLVQKVIFEEIDLLAVLSITTLSKKSRATARETTCLRHYKFHLRYLERESFRLEQKFENRNGNIFDFLLIDQARPPCPCPLWRINNQEARIGCSEFSTLAYVYSDNISNLAMETLRYLSITLPNLSLTLNFRTHDAEAFKRTMHSVEGAEEITEISVGASPDPQDEFVKLVLDESQRVKHLAVKVDTSDNFVYPTSVPFKFDSISMVSTGWVSRDHFVKLFLSCKEVQLHGKNFNDEDLTAIFRAWIERSSLEFLQFFGNLDFYREKTLGSILEGLPGAAPVRNATINFWRRGELHSARPVEEKCYRIQQRDAQTTSILQQQPTLILHKSTDKRMTIALLRFPFLVQKEIFEEIDLLSVISITMLSKKSNEIARACLHHHKYHIWYDEDYSILLERKFETEDGHILNLVLIDQTRPLSPWQLWPIGNQEVPIRATSIESNGLITTLTEVYCDNKLDFAMETLQYLSRLLPRLSVTMELKAHDVDTFRRTMRSVESVGEIKEITVVESFRNRYPDPQDEYVKLVLEESQRVKQLEIRVQTSDNFEYPTRVPFKFDSISMVSAGWVSRDHFLKLFLSCKNVELYTKDFTDEDLTAIFKGWTEGSRLEYLQFDNTLSFDQSKTLDKVFEEFPGAAPVKNAIVPVESITDSRLVKFGERKCYRIQQRDGQTAALVYVVFQTVTLSTKFRIGKEVDEMAAQINER